MDANDEKPTEEFCKEITPTITDYKNFFGLVAENNAPSPVGENRVGKWSIIMKVVGNANTYRRIS